MIYTEDARSPFRLVMWIFVVVYLLIQYYLLITAKKLGRKSGFENRDKAVVFSIFLLLIGDTVHGVYLIAAYITDDLTLLGAAPYLIMVTSLFMSSFYLGLLIYHTAEFTGYYTKTDYALIGLFAARVVTGILPSNEYGTTYNGFYAPMHYFSTGLFCAFGIAVLLIFLRDLRKGDKVYYGFLEKAFKWGLVSFLFFILHLILYPINPAFGSMMFFKSLAYIAEVYYLVKALKIKTAAGRKV